MHDKQKIYDFIFWTSMGIILLWIILKGFGIINTPVIIQLIPYAGGIFAFGVFFQMIKDLKDQIKEIKDDVKNLKSFQQTTLIDLSQINTRITHVETIVQKLV